MPPADRGTTGCNAAGERTGGSPPASPCQWRGRRPWHHTEGNAERARTGGSPPAPPCWWRGRAGRRCGPVGQCTGGRGALAEHRGREGRRHGAAAATDGRPPGACRRPPPRHPPPPWTLLVAGRRGSPASPSLRTFVAGSGAARRGRPPATPKRRRQVAPHSRAQTWKHFTASPPEQRMVAVGFSCRAGRRERGRERSG